MAVQSGGFAGGIGDVAFALQGEDLPNAGGIAGGERLWQCHLPGAAQRQTRHRECRLIIRSAPRLRMGNRISAHDGNSRVEYPSPM